MAKKISRRTFLRVAGAATGLAALGLGAQCGPTPTPQIIEKVVKETVEVVKEVPAAPGAKVIPVLVPSWVARKLWGATATMKFNELHAADWGYEIKLELTASGWDTKVLMMTRGVENLKWHGYALDTVYEYADRFARSGMIQPLEPLLAGSRVPYASKVKDDIVPSILQDVMVDGKMTFYPGTFEVSMITYRKDFLEELGEEWPETWADETALYRKAKEKLGDRIDIAFFGVTYWSYPGFIPRVMTTGKVFDADGLFDVKGDGFKAALELWRSWVQDGLASTEVSDKAWEIGRAFAMNEMNYWLSTSRNYLGRDKVDPGLVPKPEKAMEHIAQIYANGGCIFTDTPYAQEVMDYFLSIYNPETEEGQIWHQGVLNYSMFPPFMSWHDENMFQTEEWGWTKPFIEAGSRGIPIPHNGLFYIQVDIIKPLFENYLNGKISLEQATTEAYDKIREAAAKYSKEFEEKWLKQ